MDPSSPGSPSCPVPELAVQGPVPAELAGFRSVIELPIAWGDQDAIGHVNNTVPIRWFESSRIALLDHDEFRRLMEAAGVGPILAAVSCNYRRQLHYPDRVLVGSRIVRLGRTSFRMEHVVWSRRLSCVAADGECTCVLLDYAAGAPRPISAELAAAVERFEGRPIERAGTAC